MIKRGDGLWTVGCNLIFFSRRTRDGEVRLSGYCVFFCLGVALVWLAWGDYNGNACWSRCYGGFYLFLRFSSGDGGGGGMGEGGVVPPIMILWFGGLCAFFFPPFISGLLEPLGGDDGDDDVMG